MKKVVKISALALLAMGLVFNFASCSNGDDNSDSDDQKVEETQGSGSVTDTTDGDSTTTPATPTATVVSNYTLNVDTIVALGNVKQTSSAIEGATTGVTKVWATAANKSIQAFGEKDGSLPFVKMTGGSANINSSAEYGLQIKVEQKATVKITALSKQGKNACQWVLKTLDGEDGSDVESTGTAAVASAELKEAARTQQTAPADLTFANVPAGNYMLGAKSDGGYLFSLSIEY